MGILGDRAGHTKCSNTIRLWPGEEIGRTFQTKAQDMRGPREPRTMAKWEKWEGEHCCGWGKQG